MKDLPSLPGTRLQRPDWSRPPSCIRNPSSPPKQWQCPGLQTDSNKTRRQRCPTWMEHLRHARRWWYRISSKVFWGRDPSLTMRSRSPAHPADELSLLLPRTPYKERSSEPKRRTSPLKIWMTRNQIISSSGSQSPPYHLDEGTLSR